MSFKVSHSCGCTAEDCEYEVLCIVVIVTLAYGFVNAYLLCCVRLSKSTKMRHRTVEIFAAVVLLINYVEIIDTGH